jgi:3-phenylpropionate/trans-cinnamate dioxygenase ferredoxin subunit
VAKNGDIPPGRAVPVSVDDEAVLLCRTPDGELFAVEDRCSHDGSPFGACTLEGKVVACPRHGARFDVTTGAAVRMPAVTPIETRRVRVADDGGIEVAGEDD